MNAPLNRTEEFVAKVCERSFFSFWCYPNPQAPNGKELCDILIVCQPHVIIVSVKEVALNPDKDPTVAHARWERRAVEASISQLYGAERALATMSHVVRRDGTAGLDLPLPAERKVHRLAVAFGDNNQVILKSGDHGKGFVHVMGERSFWDVVTELDTIGDFTDYLAAKEAFPASNGAVICEGSEANMLAWYQTHERTFPAGQNFVSFDDSLWRGLQSDPAFRRRKEADKVSYAWDDLIKAMSDPSLVPLEGPGPTMSELDLGLRAMAREPRLSRRALGEHFVSFLHGAKAGKLRSRLLHSAGSGVTYVFVFFRNTETAEDRRAEMVGRSFLARKRIGKGEVIVGVGLSPHQSGVGSQSDFTYVRFARWSDVELAQANEYERITGQFTAQGPVHFRVDEYPKG